MLYCRDTAQSLQNVGRDAHRQDASSFTARLLEDAKGEGRRKEEDGTAEEQEMGILLDAVPTAEVAEKRRRLQPCSVERHQEKFGASFRIDTVRDEPIIARLCWTSVVLLLHQ